MDALRQIRFYLRTQGLILSQSRFNRLDREIQVNISGGTDLRWQASALGALLEAAEAYLVWSFEGKLSYCLLPGLRCADGGIAANLTAVHANRVTLQQKDFVLVRNIMSSGLQLDGAMSK